MSLERKSLMGAAGSLSFIKLGNKFAQVSSRVFKTEVSIFCHRF